MKHNTKWKEGIDLEEIEDLCNDIKDEENNDEIYTY